MCQSIVCFTIFPEMCIIPSLHLKDNQVQVYLDIFVAVPGDRFREKCAAAQFHRTHAITRTLLALIS